MAKILLIDPDALSRDMLSRRLRKRGYDVIGVEDGAQGLASAKEVDPDLILLELRLPDTDATEVVRNLKAVKESRSTPIVALTTQSFADERARARDAGCSELETKPIDFARLLGKIDSLLR